MIALDNIYNMDCLEGMKMIPDKSIDLVVTDPPYSFKDTTGGGLSVHAVVSQGRRKGERIMPNLLPCRKVSRTSI